MSQNSDTFSYKKNCPKCKAILVRHGQFFRKSDSKHIKRWRCNHCKVSTSQATGTPCFGQNKRRVNEMVRKLLSTNTSQRSIAYILKINQKTVARKLIFLANQSKQRQIEFLHNHFNGRLSQIQFDEMETFEHSKLKPLSIPLAVAARTRLILGFRVAEMPSKGLLAKKSRKKYGKRRDQRRTASIDLLKSLEDLAHPMAEILSDKNPNYPGWIKKVSKSWQHQTVLGKRGSLVGGGELKKVKFDPLFSLNHSCAMIRAGVHRMVRKTWNTTKKLERLEDQLWIYVDFHNRRIIEKFS